MDCIGWALMPGRLSMPFPCDYESKKFSTPLPLSAHHMLSKSPVPNRIGVPPKSNDGSTINIFHAEMCKKNVTRDTAQFRISGILVLHPFFTFQTSVYYYSCERMNLGVCRCIIASRFSVEVFFKQDRLLLN